MFQTAGSDEGRLQEHLDRAPDFPSRRIMLASSHAVTTCGYHALVAMLPFVCKTLALLTLLLLSGCIHVISRNPLYDREKDRVFDAKLVGTWAGKLKDGDAFSLQIKSGESASYIACLKDVDASPSPQVAPLRRDEQHERDEQQEPEELPFDLVKLGSQRYIFPCPPPPAEPANEAEQADAPAEPEHACPVARLKRRGDKLYIRPLDPNELLRIAQANPARLPHEWQPESDARRIANHQFPPKGTLILKCTREQMIEVLRKFDDQLFPDDAKLTFTRVKGKT